MKFIKQIPIFLFFLLLTVICELSGQSSTIPGSYNPSSSSPMKPLPQLPQQPTAKSQKPKEVKLPPLHYTPQLTSEKPTYFHPGILVLNKEDWKGADYLLNLTNQIGVVIEIIRPEKDHLPLSEEKIKGIVQAQFQQSGISPVTMAEKNKAALPFFEVKIFLYPIVGGYSSFCEARLFESVNMKRIMLEPGMEFQAITWQREALLLGTSDKIVNRIETQVNDFARDFTSVYKIYAEINNKDKVQGFN